MAQSNGKKPNLTLKKSPPRGAGYDEIAQLMDRIFTDIDKQDMLVDGEGLRYCVVRSKRKKAHGEPAQGGGDGIGRPVLSRRRWWLDRNGQGS